MQTDKQLYLSGFNLFVKVRMKFYSNINVFLFFLNGVLSFPEAVRLIFDFFCLTIAGGFLAFQAMYPALVESKANNSYRCTALTSLSQPCLPVSNVGPTRILPFLYLGSSQDALSLETAQVNTYTPTPPLPFVLFCLCVRF